MKRFKANATVTLKGTVYIEAEDAKRAIEKIEALNEFGGVDESSLYDTSLASDVDPATLEEVGRDVRN